MTIPGKPRHITTETGKDALKRRTVLDERVSKDRNYEV